MGIYFIKDSCLFEFFKGFLMRKTVTIIAVFSMIFLSSCSNIPKPHPKQIMKGMLLGGVAGLALGGVAGTDSVAQWLGLGVAGGAGYQYIKPKLKTFNFNWTGPLSLDSRTAREMGLSYDFPDRDPKLVNSPRRHQPNGSPKFVVAAKPLAGTANSLFRKQKTNPYYENQRYYRPYNYQKNNQQYNYQRNYINQRNMGNNAISRNGFPSSRNPQMPQKPKYYYNPQTGQYFFYSGN